MSARSFRPLGRQAVSGPGGRGSSLTIHQVAVGETVVSDHTGVLVMRTAGSAVMVLYDRARRMAAAAHFPLPRSRREGQEQSQTVPLTLFAHLIARGCEPQDLEVYAVGPGLAVALEDGPEVGRPVLFPAPMALDCQMASAREPRRIEFSVDMGRMVVERGCGT